MFEDMKEIKNMHIIHAYKIVRNNGDCSKIGCNGCPFSCNNSKTDKDCVGNYGETDHDFLITSLEFISYFQKNSGIKI